MIRRATPSDYATIEALIRRQHKASKYAQRVTINDKALSQLMLGLHASQGQSGPQASFVTVSEEHGVVRGFIAASLSRIYNIGAKLGASDLFLVNEGSAGAAMRLIDAYVAWASANPRVIEIGLTWTDALPRADRAAALYRRKGFVRTGEIFVMRLDAPAERIAA